jgi:hypothetical protein
MKGGRAVTLPAKAGSTFALIFMGQEIEKLTFPVDGADKCPKCGCEQRIGQQIFNQLKLEGKLQMTAYPKGLQIKVPLFQAILAPLAIKPEIPVIEITFDICKKCKVLYCTRIDLTAMPYEVKPGVNP